MILDRYATYTGSDPRRSPAALVTIPFVEQTFGVWHIAVGCSALAAALYQRCRPRRDLPLRRCASTGSSPTSAGRSVGVTTAEARTSLPTRWSPIATTRATTNFCQRRPGPPAACACSRRSPDSCSLPPSPARPRTIHHHNVWFPQDYDAEFDALFARNPAPVADPTIYACVPDDPAMRPAARGLVHPDQRRPPRPRRGWTGAHPAVRRPHPRRPRPPRRRSARASAVVADPHARGPGNARPSPRRQHLRRVEQLAGCPPSCARRTAARMPGLFLVGGSRTPAADCRWSGWGRRSWPRRSAGPDQRG